MSPVESCKHPYTIVGVAPPTLRVHGTLLCAGPCGPIVDIPQIAILGLLATRVLSYIVHQATPKDPIALGGVILSMLMVGMVAACIPARHALAVDPMILLREE